MNIIFTNTYKDFDLKKPVPASTMIPDWYKQMESYMGGIKKPNGQGVTSGTIKKCIPVFDAITAGYILFTPVDVYVSKVDGAHHFEWAGINVISTHDVRQAPTHPKRDKNNYLKWENPWAISTPQGYSTLFMQPTHRESVFTILTGIVDTDQYASPVHLPFVLNDPDFEGLIPAGTPMAQVVPFKRNEWNMQIGNDGDLARSRKDLLKLSTRFFDRYKNMFWSKKTFK